MSIRILCISAVIAVTACGSSGDSKVALDSGVDANADHADAAAQRSDGDAQVENPIAVARNPREGESCDGECPDGLDCLPDESCRDSECPRFCLRLVSTCANNACGDGYHCGAQVVDQAGAACYPSLALGAECTHAAGELDINPCVDGAYCEVAFPKAYCRPRLTTPGTLCGDSIGESARYICPKGFTCRNDILGGDPKCVPMMKKGEACLNHSDCEHRLRCNEDEKTCEPRGKLGAACDSHVQGDYLCPAGATCANDTCQ